MRILGFPSRLQYDEFIQRYAILAPNASEGQGISDAKKSTQAVLGALTAMSEEKYRFGHTKLFFKAGAIGELEDLRDDKIASILTSLQCFFRLENNFKIVNKTIN